MWSEIFKKLKFVDVLLKGISEKDYDVIITWMYEELKIFLPINVEET